MPAKIVMPDNHRTNSEDKPASEPPQDEATHENQHTEIQENVDVNLNDHQEPEDLNQSVEGEFFLCYT